MMTSTLSREREVLNFKISYHSNRENRKPQKFKDNSQPPSSLNSCRISPLKHRLHPSANVAQAWHPTWVFFTSREKISAPADKYEISEISYLLEFSILKIN